MIILTQQSGGTHTAQIRASKEAGFKVLYRASSTESEGAAARAGVLAQPGEISTNTNDAQS